MADIDLGEYQELKAAAEKAKRAADEARGALKQVQQQLEDEFGVTTGKQAKQLLAKLEKQETAAIKQYQSALEEFKDELGEVQDDD